jgi:hypothetical protein
MGQAGNEAPDPGDRVAAERLISKLKAFATRDLDDNERELFAALLAPGLANALLEGDEVHGFSMTTWSVGRLPDALVSALRDSSLRVVNLEDPGQEL